MILRSLLFIFITLININVNSYAGPQVKLCINDNCKNPVYIKITDTCWSEVKGIFTSSLSTDKDEQDNIVTAVALIESDVYNSMIKQYPNEDADTANERYINNSNKNHYRNIKTYLAILLDNHLVTRHFIRKTIKLKNWYGMSNYALLLQSLTNSRLYVLEIDDSKIGTSAVIQGYKDSKSAGAEKVYVPEDNTPGDEDFE